jgi:hypothetical protein
MTGIAADTQKPVLETPAREVVFKIPLDVRRQALAPRRLMRLERRVILRD